MGTFFEDLRPLINDARSVVGELGGRPYTVQLVKTRSASNPWDGAGSNRSEEVIPITVGGGQPPKVRWLTTKDYLAGYPQDCELEVTITPELSATIEQIQGESQETFWRLFGPGFGEQGTRFRKERLITQSALSWKILLKRISTSDHNGPGGTVT